jgi:hypothetical protein
MSLKEEIRLKAELRAASVLLSALMGQSDAHDVGRILDNAVVRETAHMLERGARTEAIRAFEDAASEWAARAHVALGQDSKDASHRNGSERGQHRDRH